nr:EOG090X0C7N [Eulimnadia texana]
MKNENVNLLQGNSGLIGILVAVFVVLLTGVFFLWKRRGTSRRGVLLYGLCDSGKTSLFSLLIYNKVLDTFTSLKENIGDYVIEGKAALKVVDVPGHERIRQRFLDKYHSSAHCLIFVIDSVTFTKEIRDVAECLYSVLVNPGVSSGCRSLLIVCNKQDQTLAKGAQLIKTQLEKEMNLLRTTRSNQLEAVSGSTNNNTFLGKPGKDFEFSHLQSSKVEFVEATCSGSNPDVGAVSKWIATVA